MSTDAKATAVGSSSPPTSLPSPQDAHGQQANMSKKKRTKPERAFIFENYPSRKIALRLAYHGHVHAGLAKQEDTDNTIEGLVCVALKRLRLIPETGPQEFGRCGRTDKGVSALGNCFSLIARASCTADADPQLPPLDYCQMLNSALPPTIRIVGFALVDDAFDARFSCTSRTYRYYFCHRGLNLAAMREAAEYMLGKHSFRNFCKMDVVNVSNFDRDVEKIGIYPSEQLPELISFFELKANSFLYHQIRCTMEVLFLVGRGLEAPTVVKSLLERGDAKPTYPLADGTPLVLWDCEFSGIHQWCMSHRAFQGIERELNDIATALLIRSTSAHAMRQQVFRWYADATDPCVDTASASSSQVVRRAAEDCTVDTWSITGSDWTHDGTHDLLRIRRRDLFQIMKSEDAQPAQASPVAGTNTVFVPPGYVKLMERETERTYYQTVEELGETKRARYEANEAKKRAGADRYASQLGADEASV